jgi:TIR domain
MSDIFISYAKADHALALKLSAFLEAEGWSVWWDKSLGAADLYRDEIMKQLAAAKAVITIWTENSVKSDWVRAEAGRAKAEGKLIPIKTADVAYADIPLPFGEMHTENVGSTKLIRAAIIAQLAKPTEPQSSVRQITGIFKYQALTWIGVIGTAMTLFGNLNGVLTMAEWANDLVDRWHELMHAIWLWVFAWINIRVPKGLEAQNSFLMFCYMIVIGLNLNAWCRGKASDRLRQAPTSAEVSALREPGVGSDRGAWWQKLIYWWKRRKRYYEDPKVKKKNRDYALGSAVVVPLGFIGMVILCYIFDLNAALVVPISSSLLTLVYLLYVRPSEERPWILIASLFLIIIGGFLIVVPGGNPEVMMFSAGYWLQVGWLFVIFLSPLQQLTRSLGFVVLGVVTLLALSEISKLNLHQYLQPPKVSENSIR